MNFDVKNILKSFQLFCLILVSAFSFCSYGGIDDSSQSEQLYETDIDEQNDKQNEFMEKLKPYFMTAERNSYGFDSSRPASQAFKAECGREYNLFGDGLNDYYNMYTSAKNLREDRDVAKQLNQIVSVVRNNLKTCEEKVFETFHSVMIKKIRMFEKNFALKRVQKVFKENSPQSDSSSEVKALYDLFSKLPAWNDFNEQCLYPIGLGLVGRRHSRFENTLQTLHNNNCSEKKKKFTALFSSSEFQALLDTSSLCKNSSGCVAELRKWAGLDLAGNEISFFKACANEHSVTNSCCYANYKNCKHFHSTDLTYQSLLKPAAVGGLCPASSQQMNQAKKGIKQKSLEICRESSETCHSFCRDGQRSDGFAHFREKFLQCFFLPDLNARSYQLHEKNACEAQILAIRQQFKVELAKSQYQNQTAGRGFETMESFYSGQGQSSNGLAHIDKICKEEYRALFQNKDNILQAQADQIWDSECQQMRAEREETGQQHSSASGRTSSAPISGGPRGGRFSSGSQGADQGMTGPFSSGELSGSFSTQGKVGEDLDENGDNLDPKYFSSQIKKGSDSSDDSSDFFETKGEEYEGPGDPFQRFATRTPYQSTNLNADDLFGSKNSDETENKNQEDEGSSPAGKSARSPASDGAFAFTDSSLNSPSRGFRGLARRGIRSAKKPLQSAWKMVFGDPNNTVKNVFNVHGSEVNLMDRQRELAFEFCKTHDCGENE